MKIKTFVVTLFLIISCMFMQAAEKPSKAKEAATGAAIVKLKNNSGMDLVVSMVQGGLPGQTVNQLAWLEYKSGTYSWNVPATPSSNADLSPFIFSLSNGSTITITVPEYTANVGFRCMVADTSYRSNALQYLHTSKDSVAYMSFPNLETAAYIFDKFEAGLTKDNPGIWNITAVDFVALPMQLSKPGIKVGFKDGVTFSGLKKKLSGLGLPYSLGGSTAPNTDSTTYRFFSPSHIDSLHGALDTQISLGLPLLKNFKDTVAYGNYKFFGFTGSVNAAKDTGTVSCNFLNKALNVTTPKKVTVNDVTTENSFAGEIVGASAGTAIDSSAQVELGAILSAAICRGVTGNPDKWGDITHSKTNCATPWNYYPTGKQYDSYSQLIHSYSIDDKNYGFPYDDYFGDEAGFTAVAGDTVTVTILPRDGTFKAKPNTQLPENTGCILVTVPADTIYPNSAAWQIGSIKVESNLISAGNNSLCGLNSDSVVCTFPEFPDYKMVINMNSTHNNSAISFYENGKKNNLLGITNMVYDAKERLLTFGQSAGWEPCLNITVPSSSVYPNSAAWQIGSIKVGSQEIVAGYNQICSLGSDSAVCTFPNFPQYEMHINMNSTNNDSAVSFYKNGAKSTSLGITNMTYNATQHALTFANSAGWEPCLNVTVPGTSIYPNSTSWQIGTILVGSDSIIAGYNQICSFSSDTVICTFPSFPKYEMHINMNSINNDSAVSFYKNNAKSTTLGITNMTYDAKHHALTFTNSAGWEPCLSITIPDQQYPNDTTSWQIGPIKVGADSIVSGYNQICSFSSDTVICTFPKYKNFELHIYMDSTNANTSYAFFYKGIKNSAVSITGMVYTPETYALVFGTSASWVGP